MLIERLISFGAKVQAAPKEGKNLLILSLVRSDTETQTGPCMWAQRRFLDLEYAEAGGGSESGCVRSKSRAFRRRGVGDPPMEGLFSVITVESCFFPFFFLDGTVECFLPVIDRGIESFF